MYMKKAILVSTLALLAMVLLSACSNDDEDFPTEFAGKWQLLYKEYGDRTIDTEGSGTVVNFTAERKKYSIERGYLKKHFDDGYTLWSYQFLEYGQKLKLIYVHDKVSS